MPPTTRRAKITRAERRDEIALRLFSAAEGMLENGASFTEISVEQLITEADIARSTFYVYFEDKGALLLELADRVTVLLGEAALPWLELPPGADHNDLKVALGKVVDAYIVHRHVLAAVGEAAAYDPRVREQYGVLMERRTVFMVEHFRSRQQTGAVRSDIDVSAVTPWITWMVERGLYQLLGHDLRDSSEFLDGLTSVIWHTLYESTT